VNKIFAVFDVTSLR